MANLDDIKLFSILVIYKIQFNNAVNRIHPIVFFFFFLYKETRPAVFKLTGIFHVNNTTHKT